ncbi:MAG: dihydropteroate synthase [Desulfobacula sp.]|nr:dihydropteroate synthase [Desulfobacula sp.]
MKLIADNLRITKPMIREALKALDPVPVQELVKRCAAQRPFALDINTGPLGKNPEAGMRFFIEAAESVTTLPLVIDTSNPGAMRAGLQAAKNRVIINGFSLEPRKLEQILPLAKEFDADIVGFLLYPDSRVPRNEAERFEIALELMDRAEGAGVAKERVIIDPVVPPLAWTDGIAQARAVLNVIHTLPDVLGFAVRTIGGISNLGTGAGDKAKRRLLEQSYVAMLASAGLSFALMDILDPDLVQSARVSALLAKEEIFSWAMVPEPCELLPQDTKSTLINPNFQKG